MIITKQSIAIHRHFLDALHWWLSARLVAPPLCRSCINTLKPTQNGPNFPDNIFNGFFLYENELWLQFHWSLFQRVQLTIFQHWFRFWLFLSHFLNQWCLVYWRIYMSLGLSEWNHRHVGACQYDRAVYTKSHLYLSAKWELWMVDWLRHDVCLRFRFEFSRIICWTFLTGIKLDNKSWALKY